MLFLVFKYVFRSKKEVQKAQKNMAFTYLKLGISTEEISYLLGYIEVSAFLRAFKKWTGKSISEYKKG